MSKGDHIYTERAGYTHHGIDCGDGSVIEYGGDMKNMPYGKYIIRRTTLESFADGQKILARDYETEVNSPELTIKMAESRLGEQKYSLSHNNCEHFAAWCKTNNHESDQVDGVVATVGLTGLAVAVTGVLVATFSAHVIAAVNNE
ncbi:hypothetical protein E0E54_19610 [Azotobacter chroococcum]|uniref:lecithin retinol acyltransferase family protein n=1 Tax=Azotobacter chroococcum TaxID=353 RepID=UPI001039E196|nr:lecithin retinol acyltransferase family protein [Azotobacter chroococcum]TBW32294.1 hypothetical protein E0E54_19610 [Azotobacter chroococcum]